MEKNDEESLKNNIKSLLLKGFVKTEIAKLLNVPLDEVSKLISEMNISRDLNVNTIDYYSELQKDLSKLVYSELNKDNRDANIILKAVQLQSELQGKKLFLGKTEGVDKFYIYRQDIEIKKMADEGATTEEIAKKFGISNLSVFRAIERCKLDIPDELREKFPPSFLNEVFGLPPQRIREILEQAYQEKWLRADLRNVVNKIKSEGES